MVFIFSTVYNGLNSLAASVKRYVFYERQTTQGRTRSYCEEGRHILGTAPDSRRTVDLTKRPPAPLFAILIGINKYRNISPLDGASPDAVAMQRFLEGDLAVPRDQIVTLLDDQATRSAIISALQDLAHNPKIQKGDAILIFFAGHGAEVAVQEEDSEPLGKIQSLLPQDFDGQNIHPIPDSTLESLISEVHREKGDNITVILDCCFSGSGTRQAADPYTARGVTLDDSYVMPRDTDLGNLTRKTRAMTFVDMPGALSTHVLLAACSATEYAREYNGRGQFTAALLQLLESVDLNTLRYADAIDQLDVSNQNPQCEGDNRDHLFFGGKITNAGQCHRVELRDTVYVLLAGVIDDISIGAQLDLYANRSAIGTSPPLANAVVNSVEAFESALTISTPNQALSMLSGRHLVAVQTKPGPIQEPGLYLAPGTELDFVRDALAILRSEDAHVHFSLVDDRSKALLEITNVNEDGSTYLTLHILDDLVTRCGFRSPPKKLLANPENITRLLQTAAHFFFQLHSSFTTPIIQDNVQIEFRELQGKMRRRLVPGDDLLKDGKLSLLVDRNKRVLHGIRLVNNTNRDLYVHAFYFDCSKLSIDHYYSTSPITRFVVDPPLPTHSPLTLGYGSGGANAVVFYIPPGQDNDLGFFKFVFSTRPVNLEHIPRDSPFDLPSGDTDTRGIKRTAKRQHTRVAGTQPSDVFGSVLIPVVLREAPVLL